MLPEKTTVKEQVLQALAKRPNRTARQLFTEIKSETGASAPSYQAIHKVLTQLQVQGDVTKTKGAYALSDTYLSNLEEHLTQAKQTHVGARRISFADLKLGESATVVFNEKVVAPYFWLLRESHRFLKTKSGKIDLRFYQNGLWPATILSEEEHKIIREIVERAEEPVIYCFSHARDRKWNDFFDPLWRSLGVTVKYIKPQGPAALDHAVFDDLLIEIEQEEELAVKLTHLAANIIPKQLLAKMYAFIFNENAQITVRIIRNRELAKNYHPELAPQKHK